MNDLVKKQLVTSLRVDPELWKEAKIQAIRHDLTLADVVDVAIRDWIKNKSEENR